MQQAELSADFGQLLSGQAGSKSIHVHNVGEVALTYNPALAPVRRARAPMKEACTLNFRLESGTFDVGWMLLPELGVSMGPHVQ